MTADAALSHELKSLHEELSALQQEGRSPSADPTPGDEGTATQASQLDDVAEEQQLRDELGEFVKVITEFVEEAEKNVSAHSTAKMIGAMIVGILIGRLLGRGRGSRHDR